MRMSCQRLRAVARFNRNTVVRRSPGYKQALDIYTALKSHGVLRGEDASEPDASAKALA